MEAGGVVDRVGRPDGLVALVAEGFAGLLKLSLARAELTKPYALLLTEGLFEAAEAEAKALRASQARSAEALPAGLVSINEQIAEREGFEPSNEVDPRYAISSRARSTAPAPLQALAFSAAPQAYDTHAPSVARLPAWSSPQAKPSSRPLA